MQRGKGLWFFESLLCGLMDSSSLGELWFNCITLREFPKASMKVFGSAIVVLPKTDRVHHFQVRNVNFSDYKVQLSSTA